MASLAEGQEVTRELAEKSTSLGKIKGYLPVYTDPYVRLSSRGAIFSVLFSLLAPVLAVILSFSPSYTVSVSLSLHLSLALFPSPSLLPSYEVKVT